MFDNVDNLSKIQWIDKIIQIVEGIAIVMRCLFFIIIEIFDCCQDYRTLSPKIYFWMFISYIIIIAGCFTFHLIAYIKMRKSDYSYYDCSDLITNEVIKTGNENNMKLMIYNMICTFTDGIIVTSNLIVLIVGFILDRIDNCKELDESEEPENDFINNAQENETSYKDECKADIINNSKGDENSYHDLSNN